LRTVDDDAQLVRAGERPADEGDARAKPTICFRLIHFLDDRGAHIYAQQIGQQEHRAHDIPHRFESLIERILARLVAQFALQRRRQDAPFLN
jgi:hypothetical protein